MMSRRDDERREASYERQEKKNLMERFFFKEYFVRAHMSLVSVSSLSCLLFRSFFFVPSLSFPALGSHTLIHQGAL